MHWKTKNTDATVKTILKHAKDGDIVLMHDIHKPTVFFVFQSKVSTLQRISGVSIPFLTFSLIAPYGGLTLTGLLPHAL